MAEVHITRKIDKPADELWALIGDFHGLHKWTGGAPSESIEDGKGRKFIMGPNTIIERLVDEGERSYTYSMDDAGPLPVMGYQSTISVLDDGDGTSTVDWRSTFEPPDGGSADGAIPIVTMIYEGGLTALEKTLANS